MLFKGRINKDGQLMIYNKEAFTDIQRKNVFKDVFINIEIIEMDKKEGLIKYFYGFLIPKANEGLRLMGNYLYTEAIKELLNDRFNDYEEKIENLTYLELQVFINKVECFIMEDLKINLA